MTTTSESAAITLPNVAQAHHQVTMPATLTPVVDDKQGVTVYLVSLPRETAEYFGVKADGEYLVDTTIGGLVKTRGGRWGATAYRDREAFLTDPSSYSEYIPVDAANRAQAVRMLANTWFARNRSATVETTTFSAADYRRM